MAEIDAVRAPFEYAPADPCPPFPFLKTANHPPAFLKIEAVHQLRVVGPPCRGTEVNVPVHDLLVRLGFGRIPAAGESQHPRGMREHLFELAELASASQFAGKREVGQVAPLRADLEYPRGAAHRFSQNQALGDVLGARLFAVHVLAGLGGVHGHRGMPVRSRGYQHGINIGAVQQLAKVAKHQTALVAIQFVHALLDGQTAGFLDVADRRELNVFFLQKAAEVIHSPVPNANSPHDDPFARSDSAVPAQCRAGDDRGRHYYGSGSPQRCAQKLTPRKFRDLRWHSCSPDRVDGLTAWLLGSCPQNADSIPPRHVPFYTRPADFGLW